MFGRSALKILGNMVIVPSISSSFECRTCSARKRLEVRGLVELVKEKTRGKHS